MVEEAAPAGHGDGGGLADAAGGSSPSSGPRSAFGAVAALFREAWVVEDADEPASGPRDASLAEFFEAAEVYLKALSSMGKAVGVVASDVSKNLAGAKAAFLREEAARPTLKDFLRAELESGEHRVAPGGATKLKDPSGACQMQWLLRGLEFCLVMLRMLFEGHKGAPQKAYAETLQQYHNWKISMGLKALLVAVPGRDRMSTVDAFCPDLAGDKEALAELVCREAPLAVASGLPLVLRMIDLFREAQLWETRQV
mmetsp:Transcript_131588/g.357308  ORF Transcript_131588/g.357308 Transcript_131588/m.357308 type:complete len:255 (+) Transcript_131588:9-773(+)